MVKRTLQYSHHGVYIGDGRVIHFSGEPFDMANASICETTIEDFLNGGVPRVVLHGDEQLAADVVVQNASKRLGETGYRLTANNCEHFATECCTGKPSCKQFQAFIWGGLIGLGLHNNLNGERS